MTSTITDIQVLPINFTTISDYAVANGVAVNTVQIIVTDSDNNPVEGQRVSFTPDKNNLTAVITPLKNITGKDGIATAQVASLDAKEITVIAALGNGSHCSHIVTFIPDASTPTIEWIYPVEDGAAADGKDTNLVRALVTDANHNIFEPHSGIHFYVAFTASHGTVIKTPVKTDSFGIAETRLSSHVEGTVMVSAATGDSSKTTEVHFIANPS